MSQYLLRNAGPTKSPVETRKRRVLIVATALRSAMMTQNGVAVLRFLDVGTCRSVYWQDNRSLSPFFSYTSSLIASNQTRA